LRKGKKNNKKKGSYYRLVGGKEAVERVGRREEEINYWDLDQDRNGRERDFLLVR
jgi:hypothetical protein